jgi:hypothetical protein
MATRATGPYEELLEPATLSGDPTEVSLAIAGRPRSRARRALQSLGGASPALTWIGVAVAAGGFVLLAIAWGQVAGETEVYLQIPYVVSAAFVGVGVIVVGMTALVVASKQQDAAAHRREVDELLAAIDELRRSFAAHREEAR